MNQLTELEYSVVIQALHNAKVAHFDDEFVDPYAGEAYSHTDEDVKKALDEAERKIMNLYLTK